jgi:enoyl-CoA hydratase/carnithine racemase
MSSWHPSPRRPADVTGELRLEIDDRVARLTIDRPAKRNAMTTQMWADLLGHLQSIDDSPDIVAVVLQGTGGSFSAGADLAEVKHPDPEYVAQYRDLGERAVLALQALAPPKLAVIDGPCFGAACSLALACDLRICSPASHFGIPALRNGLTYEPAFIQRLVQIVGPGSAGLLLYGGERWTADEAAARHLVDRCTPDPTAAADQIVDSLRAANPTAIALTAQAIRTAPSGASFMETGARTWT